MLSATLGALSPYIRFLLLSSLRSHCTWSSFISLDFLVIWCRNRCVATIPGSVSSSMCLYNLGGYDVRELFWIFSRGFCCILSQQWHMHYPLLESAYLCQGWQRFQLARPLGRLKSSSLEVGLIRAGVELRDGRVCLLQHLLHLRQVPCRSCIDTSRRIFQCGNFWNCPQPEASHLLSVQLC